MIQTIMEFVGWLYSSGSDLYKGGDCKFYPGLGQEKDLAEVAKSCDKVHSNLEHDQAVLSNKVSGTSSKASGFNLMDGETNRDVVRNPEKGSKIDLDSFNCYETLSDYAPVDTKKFLDIQRFLAIEQTNLSSAQIQNVITQYSNVEGQKSVLVTQKMIPGAKLDDEFLAHSQNVLGNHQCKIVGNQNSLSSTQTFLVGYQENINKEHIDLIQKQTDAINSQSVCGHSIMVKDAETLVGVTETASDVVEMIKGAEIVSESSMKTIKYANLMAEKAEECKALAESTIAESESKVGSESIVKNAKEVVSLSETTIAEAKRTSASAEAALNNARRSVANGKRMLQNVEVACEWAIKVKEALKPKE